MNNEIQSILKEHGIPYGIPFDEVKKIIEKNGIKLTDAQKAQLEHGGKLGVVLDPVKDYTGPIGSELTDVQKIQQEHGSPLGVVLDPVKDYTGPRGPELTDIQKTQVEHGLAVGVPVDGMVIYGTNDQELKEIVAKLQTINASNELDSIISILPEEAIIKVIEHRYRNIVNKLSDKGVLSEDQVQLLGKNINFDLTIIFKAIEAGKDLYESNINISNIVGADEYKNIIGLLSSYDEEIKKTGIDIPLVDGLTSTPKINPITNMPYTALELIDYVKREAQEKAVELGKNNEEVNL